MVGGHGGGLTDDVRVGRDSGDVAFGHGDYLATCASEVVGEGGGTKSGASTMRMKGGAGFLLERALGRETDRVVMLGVS